MSPFQNVQFTSLMPVDKHPRYSQFKIQQNPEKLVLHKGHVREEGRRALPVDILLERDVVVEMRDGVKLNVDIYRPVNSDSTPVPGMIAWSPYGKFNAVSDLDRFPFGMGVPKDRLSGYQKMEGPDPAEWCSRGYAVIHPDARGSQLSEGNLAFWGTQEAEDVYDTIEWISKQAWCSGSICMAGNSWLAKAQINFAAKLSHPALKAIAPWEGFTDIYRQFAVRGGMPTHPNFVKLLAMSLAGPNAVENMPDMVISNPLFNGYWADKHDQLERIHIPMYILGSYSSMFHSFGSFDMFQRSGTHEKWLRVHPYYEWYDLYRPDAIHDLARFFDRYCKGIQNGWEKTTPPVRLSLIGFDGSIPDVIERPEQDFPLTRQNLKRFYLNAETMMLQPSVTPGSSLVTHQASDSTSDFILRFSSYTEIAGYARVRLWMSTADSDDMDVVVQIRKINKDGNFLSHVNYPVPVPYEQVPNINIAKYIGPQGTLRASHAVSLDESKSSKDGQVLFYKHDRQEKVPPGKIVPLDITLWPMGMVFDEGEGICLRVAGHDLALPELILPPPFSEVTVPSNPSMHKLHTGGQHDSYIILPFV